MFNLYSVGMMTPRCRERYIVGKPHEMFKDFSRTILHMQEKKKKKFQSIKKKAAFKFAI